MRLQRTVVTDKPLGKVFDYLSDFTSTTDWDPGTVTTIRLDGDGGVGTSYLNTSEFLGRRSCATSCKSSCPVNASGSAARTRR